MSSIQRRPNNTEVFRFKPDETLIQSRNISKVLATVKSNTVGIEKGSNNKHYLYDGQMNVIEEDNVVSQCR